MHHANHFYGHAHIMAEYCGLDVRNPPRIAGYLQHGWNIRDGLGVDVPLVAGRPVFAWSAATARRARAAGRPAVVTGTPWLYLQRLRPEPERADRRGTIWYPFHGWEHQKVQGDHGRLIAMIKEVETEPVTVCLYWNEHRDPEIRARYESAGFRVICHGYRGRMWHKTDRLFLHKQLAELRAHRRVASNRLSTAVFYGTMAGCTPAVYGDPMVLGSEDLTYGGNDRVRRQWPEMHGTDIDVAAAREATRTELGVDHLASPDEIRELFRWPAPARAPTAALTAVPIAMPTRAPAPRSTPTREHTARV